MSVGVLIIAHNDIGLSLVNTANQMIKENPLKIKVLTVDLESTTDELHKNALSLIESIDNGDGVLILTDIFGSTPSNVSYKLFEKDNISIVSGVNLSMLIRIVNYSHLNLKEMAKKAYSGGIDGININDMPKDSLGEK